MARLLHSGAASALLAVLIYFIGCSNNLLSAGVCHVYSSQRFRSHFDAWLPVQRFSFRDYASSSDAAGKRERFEQAFLVIRQELLDAFASQGVPEDAQIWYTRIIDYNVPGGKLNRGMSVVDSVEIMKGRMLSKSEFLQAAVLGWAVEFLQAYFLVLDDLMDKSTTRRGQPCYYRLPGVGTISVNDAGLLEAAIYQLLKLHFRNETYYIDLVELFHETTYQTSTGQLLDLITAPEDSVDLSKISIEKFHLIAQYRTAYYSFYLPVALAMLMCEIPLQYQSWYTGGNMVDPYTLARTILLRIGEYFQVQDDFLDFAGTPEEMGKVGTDIVDNKCSWCINTALGLASADQRAILDANYGRRDPSGVMEASVKAVFEDVGLRDKYHAYEEEVYKEILALIEGVPEDDGISLKREVFTRFLYKIYKRRK